MRRAAMSTGRRRAATSAGQGSIRRATLKMPAGATAASCTDIEVLFSNMPEPIDLDLDLATRAIYWTDRGDNTVNRAPMDRLNTSKGGEGGYDPAGAQRPPDPRPRPQGSHRRFA